MLLPLFLGQCMVYSSFWTPTTILSGSEGAILAMEDGGAGNSVTPVLHQLPAKQHGCRPLMDSGLRWGNATTQQIRKRSLRRAHRRLQLHGHTWYRGQLWQQEVPLPKPPTFVVEPPQHFSSQPPEHLPHNRLVIWHWNAGMLTPSRYQELLHYLHLQKVDVALISETHWNYTNEWDTMHWHVIHSGCGSSHSFEKASGLLMLISKKICQAHHIAWHAIAPGRLIHCRLHLSSKPVDVIGIYQYPWNTTIAQKTRRQMIWKHLRNTIQALPQRNTLCALGDYNCSLPHIARLVGTSNFCSSNGRMSGPQHGDMADFARILQDFQLTALNSWSSHHGATFTSHAGESRIDFILTRHRDADTLAKQVGLLHETPFLPSGAHHLPMLTSLNHKFFRPSRSRLMFPRQVRQTCLAEFRQDTLHWQQCENGINHALRSHPNIDTLEDIYTTFSQGMMHYFHQSHKCRQDGIVSHVALKWMHFKKMRDSVHLTLKNVFHAWWHSSQFQKLERDQTRHAKMIKQRKIQQLTEEAQHAHEQHDSFKLYNVISRHCPKMRNKRIHLRGDDGKFLTPTEETAAYVHHIQTNWAGPSLTFPDLAPPGVPFDVAELERVLQNIPATKAVPARFPPGPIWKSQAHFLAPWLHAKLLIWWGSSPPHVPQAWKDAWACWLPKPHKPSTRLDNLRMLGLQEPLGKAILKLVTQKALQYSFSRLCSWPQFAYLPHRSTRDALLRAAAHCRNVRLLLEAQRRTIHATTKSQPRLACVGGIQLFLDLTRAFDALPRPVLCEALSRVQLTPQLQSILLAWHIDTHYHIDVNNTSRCIPVSRGMRQGCSSAPFLWATTMVLLLDDLQKHVPLSWIRDHITIYADDLHIFCIFQDETELQDALRFFDAVIMAIDRLGLTLSAQKSCILLKGKGAGFFKWKKTSVDMSQKTNPCLKLCNGHVRVPIKKQCLYLGTMLSYGDFHKQTVELRVKAGWNNFHRLQPWLCRKHKVSLALRLQLMQTCIVPTICYGIFYIGLTPYGIDLLCKTFNMMYRRIMGHVPHISRINTSTVLAANRIQTPLLTLHHLVTQAHVSMISALQLVPTHDIIHLTHWTTLDETRTLISSSLARIADFPTFDFEAPPLVCGFCTFYTDSPHELQKHYTLAHSRPRLANTKVDFAQDTINGMPTCRYCQKDFQTWQGFRMHRRFNVCNSYFTHNPTLPDSARPYCDDQDSPLDSMVDPAQHSELLARAQVFATEADYDSVMHDRPLCNFMQSLCILCSKHVVSLRSLTSHLRANHPGQMQEAISLGIQRTRQHTGNQSPCGFCSTSFRRTHLCPVTTQVAVLEMQVSTPDDPRHFTCFLCQFVAPDRLQLRRHLASRHQFPCFDWTPARDSLPDQVTCAHCGTVCHCLEGLRKHIIYGHCSQFDANRPWTRNGDSELVEQLRLGRVDLLLSDGEVRKRLTLHCQLCTQTFVQACNLINHLHHQHGDLAAEAELFRQVLQQRYAPRGCYCMPPVRSVKQTHQCVAFLQLSMIHYNGNHLLSIPISYDATACDRMDNHIPVNCLNLVHECLQTRDFALLQQDPAFRMALQTRCLCCGTSVTLTGPVQEHVLWHHLKQHHSEPRQVIECLIQMVIYRKQHDHLQFCDWCGVAIVPVNPHTEYDNHLAECPVLLHFATWLSIPFVPLPHGSTTRRHSNADAGGSGQYGHGLRGAKRPRDEEKEGLSISIKDIFSRQRLQSSRIVKNDVPHGHTGPETRAGPDGTAIPKQLCAVPVNSKGRNADPTASRECQLEEGSATASSHDAIETTFVSIPAENPDPTGLQIEGLQEGRSSLAIKPAISTCATGWVMAVPSVEPWEQEIGAGCQDSKHSYGRDVGDPGTNPSSNRTANSSHSFPLPPEQEQGSSCHTLEVGTGYEERKTACSSPVFTGEFCVATDLSADQNAPSGSVQDGRRFDEDDEAQVNRDELCTHLIRMVLLNDDVQCFVNTVFLTVMWTHFLCSDFYMDTWGTHTGPLLRILLTETDNPLGIRSHPFFGAVFEQWQQLRSHGQHDYGDFLGFFLGWLGTTLVAQTFQRRYLTADGVVIAEKSAAHTTILLHSELWQDLESFPSFQLIIDNWTQVNGMTSALAIASRLVCFQFCRFQSMMFADSSSFDFGDLTVFLTAFTNDQMATARISYRVAALVSYAGDSWRGHYTCAIPCTGPCGKAMWIFHDDNKSPQRWYILPSWFSYTVTHVWLVRSDKYVNWQIPQDILDSASPDPRACALERVLAELS